MPWMTNFRFYAVKPMDAEHPIGSGTIVHYDVGEEIPGGDWGRSIDWLVENGRAVRMADNVWVEDGTDERTDAEYLASGAPVQEPAVESEVESALEEPVSDEPVTYPVHEGRGWYRLSDGSKVRTRETAEAAEAALGG